MSEAPKGAKSVKELETARKTRDSVRLTPEGASAYRAPIARCNDVARDRPDLAYAAEELCRDFAVPHLAFLGRLKRMNRYIKSNPRLGYHIDWPPVLDFVNINVDTDFAGCEIPRRSTSGRGFDEGRPLYQALVERPEHCCVEFW